MEIKISDKKSDELPKNPSYEYSSSNIDSKSVTELVKLFMYICAKKLWRAQILLCVLFIVASTIFLSLFWYDTVRNELKRQKETEKFSDSLHQHLLKFIAKNHHKKLLYPWLSHQTATPKRHPVYYDDGLHTEWKFEITKTYEQSHLHEWVDSLPESLLFESKEHNESIPSYGENGTRFIPPPEFIPLMKKLYKKQNYNLLASQMISVNRSLPDLRYPECKELSYPDHLPSTSIIIVFHNEEWPTLIRTIWSIVNRSPHQLIREIILVDDLSTDPKLKQPLDAFVKNLPVNVKIIRTNKREGLIRARLIGARAAKGEILTFFDAHVECNVGWLPPILARIATDRSVVAVPVIGRISSIDLAYSLYTDPFGLAGFRWHLIFSNMTIPQRERIRTKNDRTAPLRTPTHVGCAFSIDREFFSETGSYDEKMDVWGSENLEMALRVWQCGGSFELIPCSHVGHLFRISTYNFGGGDASKITARNNVRLIEVWMDEFKHLIYAANPKLKDVSPGDLSQRINLRNKLKCKSFRWYLENIFPESNLRKKYRALGEVVSLVDQSCLDVYKADLSGEFSTFGCHGMGGNQFFAFAENGQIISAEDSCVGVSKKRKIMTLVECSDHDRSQLWKYDESNKWISHAETGLCITNNMPEIELKNCDPNDVQMKWKIKSSD